MARNLDMDLPPPEWLPGRSRRGSPHLGRIGTRGRRDPSGRSARCPRSECTSRPRWHRGRCAGHASRAQITRGVAAAPWVSHQAEIHSRVGKGARASRSQRSSFQSLSRCSRFCPQSTSSRRIESGASSEGARARDMAVGSLRMREGGPIQPWARDCRTCVLPGSRGGDAQIRIGRDSPPQRKGSPALPPSDPRHGHEQAKGPPAPRPLRYYWCDPVSRLLLQPELSA